jgi:uncharacterized Fe-S center protein
MTIEPVTFLIVALSAVTLLCVYGFVRALLRERKAEMANRINDVEETLWRESEKMYNRINHLERVCREQDCCKTEKYPTKNHYNTEA